MATSKRKKSNSGAMGMDWFGFGQNAAPSGQEFGPVYEGMMQFNQEFMDLFGQRCRAYMELPHRVSKCQSPEDVLEMEKEFLSETQDQYKDFVQRSWMGQFTMPTGMFGGAPRKESPRPVQKTEAKRKGPARKKTQRKTSKRGLSENGSGVYSYPEHVSGRHDVRGRVH